MLKTLNASNLSCRLNLSCIGNPLNIERSILTTVGPRNALRPRFPNAPDGMPKAHGLNQLNEVCTASAARPPCEMVFWQLGSGFADTGPGLNGSAIKLGLRYVPGAFGAPPLMFARSPVTCRL